MLPMSQSPIQRPLFPTIQSLYVSTILQQNPNGFDIPVGASFMQRGPTISISCLNKRWTTRENFFDQIGIIPIRRSKQSKLIHIRRHHKIINRAMLHQQPANLSMPPLPRKMNRIAVPFGNPRAILDQNLNRFQMPPVGRINDGCPLPLLRRPMNIGPVIK